MTKKLVSLIIPVYNVEQYLKQCLESVKNQIYPNIEVILVNDGSTDNSLSICRYYAQENGWILVNQENSGLSAARNAGINQSTGEYIAFLDSDDWIEPDFIQNMIESVEKYDADIVESGIRWVYSDNIRVECISSDTVFTRKEALASYLLQTKPLHSAVWCKLYNRKIFKNLQFAVGRLHEDGFFTYRAMYNAESYVVLNYAGYNYRQNRTGSIMSASVKSKNIKDVTDMMEERISFFEEENELELAEMAAAYYYRTTLTNYVTAITRLHDQQLASELKRKLYENKLSIMKNKRLGNRKIKFIIFYYFPHIFSLKYLREHKK